MNRRGFFPRLIGSVAALAGLKHKEQDAPVPTDVVSVTWGVSADLQRHMAMRNLLRY